MSFMDVSMYMDSNIFIKQIYFDYIVVLVCDRLEGASG